MHLLKIPCQKPKMLNKNPHQIDRSNYCQHQPPYYPVNGNQFILAIMLQESYKHLKQWKHYFSRTLYLQSLQEFSSSTLGNGSKTINKFLSRHTNRVKLTSNKSRLSYSAFVSTIVKLVIQSTWVYNSIKKGFHHLLWTAPKKHIRGETWKNRT